MPTSKRTREREVGIEGGKRYGKGLFNGAERQWAMYSPAYVCRIHCGLPSWRLTVHPPPSTISKKASRATYPGNVCETNLNRRKTHLIRANAHNGGEGRRKAFRKWEISPWNLAIKTRLLVNEKKEEEEEKISGRWWMAFDFVRSFDTIDRGTQSPLKVPPLKRKTKYKEDFFSSLFPMWKKASLYILRGGLRSCSSSDELFVFFWASFKRGEFCSSLSLSLS